MRYLLDTCIISELVKNRPEKQVVEWVEMQEEMSLYLSVLSFGELREGISKLPESRKRIQLQSWVDKDLEQRFTSRVLDIDRVVADRWGELSGAAEKIGRRIPVLDGLLAATALVYGLTFVTRNIDDVRPTDVPLLNPWSL